MTMSALRARLSRFYTAHWSALWAYLIRLGADSATAQDLAQESFTRWAASPATEWDDARGRAYLYGIAYRLFIDSGRRLAREARMAAYLSPAGAESREDTVLAASWERLPERERQILWLAYAEEFTHEEIASIIGGRAASIRVLLSRARARARKMLGGDRE